MLSLIRCARATCVAPLAALLLALSRAAAENGAQLPTAPVNVWLRVPGVDSPLAAVINGTALLNLTAGSVNQPPLLMGSNAAVLLWRASSPGVQFALSTTFSPLFLDDSSVNVWGASVVTSIGAAGEVPVELAVFNTTVVSPVCSYNLFSWVFSFTGAGGEVYAPVVVPTYWHWSSMQCQVTCVHGFCNNATGECQCDPGYIGSSCNIRFSVPQQICPSVGGPIIIDWELPQEESTTDTYNAYTVTREDKNGVERTVVDMRFFTTLTSRVPEVTDRRPSSGKIEMFKEFTPGLYVFRIKRSLGDQDDWAQTSMLVLPYEECGINGTCDGDDDCGGAHVGKCSASNNQCQCNSSRFWSDCSHGCQKETVISSNKGVILSDLGSNGTLNDSMIPCGAICSWTIQPTNGNWNSIKFKFEWLHLRGEDVIRLMTDNQDQPAVTIRASELIYSGSISSSGALRIQLAGDMHCNGRGFKMSFETERVLTVNDIILLSSISAGVVVILVASVAVVFVLRNRNKKPDMANSPAPTWSLEEEKAETEQQSSSRASEGYALMKDNIVRFGKNSLDFGLCQQETIPVDEDQYDQIIITNECNRALSFSAFVPDGGSEFSIELIPGAGVIQPGETVSLTAKFKLSYTVTIKRAIKIVFTTKTLWRTHHMQTSLISLSAVGGISDKLDPEEIMLDKKPLGAGGFGAVYKGVYRSRKIAVKVLRNQHMLTEEQLEEFDNEIDLYRRLHSPLIVQFIGASHIPGRVCLCTELMELGNLESLIRRMEIPFALQLRFASNVAEAVFFLHSNNVLYRDLKPGNILIASLSMDAKVNCKISDFGTAKNVKDVKEFFVYTRAQGTPIFMAPEALKRSMAYNNKTDVFSYAVTMWQMLTRKDPWENTNTWDIPKAVISGQRMDIPDGLCPMEYSDLIKKCWADDPVCRPEFSEVLFTLKTLLPHAAEPVPIQHAPLNPRSSTELIRFDKDTASFNLSINSESKSSSLTTK